MGWIVNPSYNTAIFDADAHDSVVKPIGLKRRVKQLNLPVRDYSARFTKKIRFFQKQKKS